MKRLGLILSSAILLLGAGSSSVTWDALALGSAHTCVVRQGSLYCWGDGSVHQLGDGRSVTRGTPKKALLPAAPSQVVAGDLHSCALLKGTAWCWGHGLTFPTQIQHPHGAVLEDIVQLASGNHHTCARREDQQIFCWGANGWGQLGDGTRSDSGRAQQVKNLPQGPLVNLVSGGKHSCVLSKSGQLWCWGSDLYGQLGGQNRQYISDQGKLLSLDFVVEQVVAGRDHLCARGADQHLYCWGRNSYGELGARSYDICDLEPCQKVPLDLGLIPASMRLWSGGENTCVEQYNGVRCWGQMAMSAGVSNLLVQSRPKSLAIGAEHLCLVDRGHLSCLGDNNFGQLGTGVLGGSSLTLLPVLFEQYDKSQ